MGEYSADMLRLGLGVVGPRAELLRSPPVEDDGEAEWVVRL